MSMEDLFGSDLEDSEDEEKVKTHEKGTKNSQLNDLFGESGSEEEEQDVIHDRKDASDEESEDDKDKQESENEQEEEEQEEVQRDNDTPQVSTKDLFGDEDISSEEEDKDEIEQVQDQQQESDTNEEESRQREEQIAQDENLALGFVADEEEAEEEPENRLEVEIPYCRVDRGNELSFVKFPNFMSVDTKPFDSALYEDEVEDDEVLDDEGRARLKLRVENTIRWRNAVDKDGNEIKESNARIVRWSDGTMSLMLGGEVFDVHKMKIEGDYNHLFVQQGTGLQGQAVFKDKLTFRPHSTNSQTHRKMTLSIADRVSKAQKIKMVPASGKDPESQRNELIKKEEERLRAQIRRENQQRRMRERSHAKGLSANYLEPDRYDEDEDNLEESLLAIKNKYKNRLKDLEAISDAESDTAADIFEGGLDSDEEESEMANKVTESEGNQEDSLSNTPSKRPSSEIGGVKKKKRIITESDEEESE